MTHEEAIRLMGAEQYLLNELSPELREQFEEHFFECAECGEDVRAGALLIDQSKAIFASEQSAPSPKVAVPERKAWFAWLRPAFAVPALALLLAVVVYQNWPRARNPQVLQAAFINVGSRGNVPSINVRSGEGFLLRVTLPPDRNSASYSADIYAPDGKLAWSLDLPSAGENDSVFIQVPAAHYQDGIYAVAIRGAGTRGTSSEIGRSTFELHIVK